MKPDIHPKYKKCAVNCACGASFETRSVLEKINVEICSQCHPFYTGRQKFVDTAGRIEKFTRKYKDFQATDRNKGGRKGKGAAPKPVEAAATAVAETAVPAAPVAPAEAAAPADTTESAETSPPAAE